MTILLRVDAQSVSFKDEQSKMILRAQGTELEVPIPFPVNGGGLSMQICTDEDTLEMEND